MQAVQAILNSVFSFTVINGQAYQMNNSHVVQTLLAPLIKFPHYYIIALKVALGNVMCCVNMHFIILANPLHLHFVSHDSTPHHVSTCLSSLDIIGWVNNSGFSSWWCWHRLLCLLSVFFISQWNKAANRLIAYQIDLFIDGLQKLINLTFIKSQQPSPYYSTYLYCR